MSTKTEPEIRLCGVLYDRNSEKRFDLKAFALDLKSQGIRVHGLVQETTYDTQGRKIAMDALSLCDGRKIALARPGKEDIKNGSCAFDDTRLAETSAVITAALAGPCELLVIEKFGEREQNGSGLLDEIMLAAQSGIATLVSVPRHVAPLWQEVTGGLGALIEMDRQSLDIWWRSAR